MAVGHDVFQDPGELQRPHLGVGQLLEWKLISCVHGQELGRLAVLASDWLFTLVPGASLLVYTTLDNDNIS